MTLKPRRARYMSFWSSAYQHKVHWARLGRIWLRNGLHRFKFFPATGEQICISPFYPSADASVVLGLKGFERISFFMGRENLDLILPIFVFWAFLLRIETPIFLSKLGVRSSSLDSSEILTIPFNSMPNETWKMKIEKKWFCWGQTDSTFTHCIRY